MSPSSPAGSSSSSLPISNALLALPDGPIPADHPDASSFTVSFLGGYPTFPSIPASSSSSWKYPSEIRCGVCHETMPLLAQVYCPPDGGENDRTVYVWACVKGKCQRREGSIRAFRASARNEEYVKDVEQKRLQAERERQAEREKAKINPFAMPNGQPAGALFGSAQPLFGGPSNSTSSIETTTAPPDISSLSIASATTLGPPLPAFQPPQYLSTIGEYIPPPEDADDDDDLDDDDDEEMAEFKDEKWEKILPKNVDEVFEAFVRRLQSAEDGDQQVLRYELGGVPLPYSSMSPLFRKLFPKAPVTSAPKAAEEEEEDFAQYFDPSPVSPCPRCHSKRVFEMQLVPSLINSLRPEAITTTGSPNKSELKSDKSQSEEERKKELARLAAGEIDEVGMEWGTIMVFGCEADCVGFSEEWVGVEWENVGA